MSLWVFESYHTSCRLFLSLLPKVPHTSSLPSSSPCRLFHTCEMLSFDPSDHSDRKKWIPTGSRPLVEIYSRRSKLERLTGAVGAEDEVCSARSVT